MTDLLVTGIGTVVSGRLDDPLLQADAILCRDGRIQAIGWLDDVHPGGEVPTLDVAGATIAPGLIDAHTHPVLGDFTPRHNALGWIESSVHGGVTTLISAGEPHSPGRPTSRAGTKALAVLAHQSFASVRPGGARVHAGAVLLEPGLIEADFEELAAAGVWLVGEIGISGIHRPDDALPMVRAAKRNGFMVTVHVGGASVPGSSVIGANTVLALEPHVASHINGGPTAPPPDEIAAIIADSKCALEVVQAGNIRALVDVAVELKRRGELDRLQVGSDTPSGTGVIPLSVLRVLAYLSAFAEVPPEVAIACATGLTAARYGLDVGELAVGRPADLVVLDAARGSAAGTALDALSIGDTPSVACVIVDGEIQVFGSRVAPPPKRVLTRPNGARPAAGH